MGYNPSYKWTNPTYPIYNQGYNPLTKWDEPPSIANYIVGNPINPIVPNFLRDHLSTFHSTFRLA